MIIVALSSNSDTKSPVPPMNAPSIAANAIDVSMVKSFLGSILFSFSVHSSVISGIPPILPPIMYFPFRSSNLKLFIFFLDTINEPSLFVSPANVIG